MTAEIPVLAPEVARALARGCLTVVKPGETLVIRVPAETAPYQLREFQAWLDAWHADGGLPFRVIALPGAEFTPVTQDDEGREKLAFGFEGALWRGVPVVNGHRLHGVESFDVHVEAGEVPAVTVRLAALDDLRLMLGGALVSVGDETRAALVSLGWTPPAADVPAGGETEIVDCNLSYPVTREQALAWAQSARWHLKSFYKHSFTFDAYCTVAFPGDPEAHEAEALATVSGQPGDFYRFGPDASEPMSWDDLCYVRTPDLLIRDGGEELIRLDGSDIDG